jgi:hypothetical protein
MKLNPAAIARVSEILARNARLLSSNTTFEEPIAILGGTTRPMIARPAPGSSAGSALRKIVSPEAMGFKTPPIAFDWDHPLLFSEKPLADWRGPGLRAKLPRQTQIPLQKAQYQLQSISPGLWLRPLPVSEKAFANAGRVVTIGQNGAAILQLAGVQGISLPLVDATSDLISAGIAVAEIYQEIAQPKDRGTLKKTWFYLKRGLYVGIGIAHVVPVPGMESLKLVGVLVKLCKVGDAVYGMAAGVATSV